MLKVVLRMNDEISSAAAPVAELPESANSAVATMPPPVTDTDDLLIRCEERIGYVFKQRSGLKSALTRMTDPVAPAAPAGATAPPAPAASPAAGAQHDAEGVVEAMAKDAVTLSHGPVPALRWPAMTMDFKPPAGGVPASIKPGMRVRFSFRQTGEGEFAIVAIQPAPAAAGAKR